MRNLLDFDNYIDSSVEDIFSEGKVLLINSEKKSYLFIKRAIDIIFSAIAIIVLSPVFLVTAIAIKLDSKGPVLFSQQRVGKKIKPFRIYKFRSMCTDADQKIKEISHLNEKDGPIFKIKNDPRVTKVGQVLRKTSIDELPQFFNVLRGDMSIVGPRPPLPNEVENYSVYQLQRLSVTPGLTCYWQIGGRSNLSFNEWVELDLKYIRERCLWTDLKIALKTIPAVFFGDGAC